MPVFKAKTGEAYQLKVLAELLTNNLKTGCFEFSEDGISLRQCDTHRRTLIDLDLPSENFCLYRFKHQSNKMFLGLNLTHFHRMLKTIKKKDSLQVLIEEGTNDLALKAIPKENTRITTSKIKIQSVQALDIEIPEGYGKPVIVSSSEFQKMAKEMLGIGNLVRVTAKDFHICFDCDAGGGVYQKSVEFGESEHSDEESDSDEDQAEEFSAEFATDQLTRIAKIAGLSTTMQIFPAVGLPLLIRSRVGSLGHVSIYIKSKEQVEEDDKDYDSNITAGNEYNWN